MTLKASVSSGYLLSSVFVPQTKKVRLGLYSPEKGDKLKDEIELSSDFFLKPAGKKEFRGFFRRNKITADDEELTDLERKIASDVGEEIIGRKRTEAERLMRVKDLNAVPKVVDDKENDSEPRIFGTVELDILDPFFHVERSFCNGGALEYVRGRCYAKAEIKELKKKIIVETERPISQKRFRMCLTSLTSEEVQELKIPEHVLNSFAKVDANGRTILEGDHGKRDPGVFFKERSRLNPAYVKALRKKTVEEFDELVDYYLCDGYDYDPRTFKWGESLIIRISDDPRDHFLMKYRGHALIIKNSASGFTTISERVGKCYGHGTEASLRGFSDGRNDRNSLLDQEFGSVGIDEFLSQDPIAQGILNYTQLGRGLTASGGVELEYEGLAKMSFVGNFDRDATTPEAMTIALERGMEKLTAASAMGLGARFGYVLFDDQVKPAVINAEIKITRQQSEENKAAVEEVIKAAMLEARNIYEDPDVLSWLNTPDEEYAATCRSLAGQIVQMGNNKLRTFVDNSGNAYRHVKGFALEIALKRHLQGLFLKDYDPAAILATAKQEYEEVKSVNLNSFIKAIGWFSALDVHSLVLQWFNNLPSEAAKAVIIGLHEAVNQGACAKAISEDELKIYFEAVEEELRRIILGNFAYWSLVKQKIPRKYSREFESCLKTSFCVEVGKSGDLLTFRVVETDLLKRLDLANITKRRETVKTDKDDKEVKEVKTVKGTDTDLTDLTVNQLSEREGGAENTHRLRSFSQRPHGFSKGERCRRRRRTNRHRNIWRSRLHALKRRHKGRS